MLEYWMWLAHRPGLSDHLKVKLLQYFHTPEGVYTAREEEFSEFHDLNPAGKEALQDKNLEPYTEALAKCDRDNIRILTFQDPEYPQRLTHIFDPPLLLYCRGTYPNFDSLPVIGVVGTRKASVYGMNVSRRFGEEISRCGGVVLSGLAAGVDASAMSGALSAGGYTVGVLGCGVDVIFPRSNRELFAAVEKHGCILSEFLPGTPPYRWNFPRRNRVISGLSSGVLVVEAPVRSGSLITARYALDQGRDVFVVPGNIDLPGFEGSNRLLQDGAFPVSCGWDIMCEYQAFYPDRVRRDPGPTAPSLPISEIPEEPRQRAAQKPGRPKSETPAKKDIDNVPSAPYIDLKPDLQGLSENERAVVTCLMDGERLADDVIAQTGIPAGKFLSVLTMLELKHLIVRLPGKRIALREKK